jgi:trans-2-enoyl-CoA reductase
MNVNQMLEQARSRLVRVDAAQAVYSHASVAVGRADTGEFVKAEIKEIGVAGERV